MTPTLFPVVEPYARGMLDVGAGNFVAWEIAGNPQGAAAVVLHGGPGQGASPNMRRALDPEKYRVLLFDQRGCGRSLPHASEPTTELAHNTTHHLVADMESLRQHLGIERWLVSGGSWGSTLALAYAERHPERVSAMVLSGVTTTRRAEIDWLYRDVARFFPEAYERFAGREPDPIAAYARRMEHPDLAERLAAARAWCEWEHTVLSFEPTPSGYVDMPAEDMLAFVRICAHYLAHAAWLDDGLLLREAHRLRGIPGVLIHGRRDLSCPVDTAFALARAWPDAELVILEHTGHLRSDEKRAALLAAYARFTR